MKTTDFGAGRASETPRAQRQWTNFRVSMLGLWSFLLGANLVRVASVLAAHERWWGPALGAVVSLGSLAGLLYAARARPEQGT